MYYVLISYKYCNKIKFLAIVLFIKLISVPTLSQASDEIEQFAECASYFSIMAASIKYDSKLKNHPEVQKKAKQLMLYIENLTYDKYEEMTSPGQAKKQTHFYAQKMANSIGNNISKSYKLKKKYNEKCKKVAQALIKNKG